MYEAHFGFSEAPFTIQPDPAFLYFARRHSAAYTMLEYAILNRQGFTAICGDIGCGKTTLVRHLLREQGDGVTFGVVTNTHPDLDNILEWVMHAFGQKYEFRTSVGLYDAFQQFLVNHYRANRRIVLVIDEAQNLSARTLEELRMLSNLNADKTAMLQIILVGQPQLRDLLARPELKQFAQRVSVQYFLPPLPYEDVQPYIQHRMRIAGSTRTIFSNDACSLIASASHGVPRVVNILCDTALVYAFSAGDATVELGTVEEVLRDRGDYAGPIDISEPPDEECWGVGLS